MDSTPNYMEDDGYKLISTKMTNTNIKKVIAKSIFITHPLHKGCQLGAKSRFPIKESN